ncbi:MAG: hypothetical protein ACR2NP_01295 [Pirellulaceae bacterium]
MNSLSKFEPAKPAFAALCMGLLLLTAGCGSSELEVPAGAQTMSYNVSGMW